MRRVPEHHTEVPSPRDYVMDAVDARQRADLQSTCQHEMAVEPARRTGARPRPMATATSFTRPREAATLAVTSRDRTAWMLAHAPEYSNYHNDDDARDGSVDDARQRLVARAGDDSSRWRPTTVLQHRRTTAWPHELGGSSSRHRGTSDDYEQSPFPRPRFLYESPQTFSHPRYLSEDAPDSPLPLGHAQGLPLYPRDEAKEDPWTPARNQDDEMPLRRASDESVGLGADSDGDSAAAVQDADSDAAVEPSVPKTSRYLREMDRRVILERLAQGEKQASLAKEFNVSRAAISNLFKHRSDILARGDEDPFAKHPKKKKKKPAKPRPQKQRARSLSELEKVRHDAPETSAFVAVGTTQHSTGTDDPSSTDAMPAVDSTSVVLVKSRALSLLLSTMGDSTRSLAAFRRTSERALWLLLEDALASVPMGPSDSSTEQPVSFPSYVPQQPSCAISLEQEALSATPMLNIFQLMEPQHPSATATVTNAPIGLTVKIPTGGLPQSLRGYNVFVLDVVAASGEAVCTVLERLMRQWGATEASVCVVSLFTSSEVVAMVQCKYPLAKIVTARIDSSITRRRLASTPVDLILHRLRQAYGDDDEQWAQL